MKCTWWASALIGLLALSAGCDLLGVETEDATQPAPGTYYVSNQDGDDRNDGQTRETAFRTVERALGAVQPRDTILILPGVYNEGLTLEDVGSSNAPITIRGEDGVPVLDGQRALAIGIWCEDCTNFVFENLEIRNYTDVGIGVYLSTDIVVQDLMVHDSGFRVQLTDWELEGYGIHVDESQHITIEGNDVYQNGPNPRPWGVLGTGINTYRCVACVIRDNHSHGNIGGGILVEDGVDVLVEGNTVTGNDLNATEDGWWDGGIWLDGGHDITVRDNVFRDNLGPGIQVSDEDRQKPYNYVIENNISTDNYFGAYIWNLGTAGLPPEDVLRMSANQISGNTEQDIWIVP